MGWCLSLNLARSSKHGAYALPAIIRRDFRRRQVMKIAIGEIDESGIVDNGQDRATVGLDRKGGSESRT